MTRRCENRFSLLEWTRCELRLIVERRGQRSHPGESGDRDWIDARFGGTTDHRIGVSEKDHVERVPYRLNTGCTCGTIAELK